MLRDGLLGSSGGGGGGGGGGGDVASSLRAAGCGADTNHSATPYAIDLMDLRFTTCHTDIRNSKYTATTARRSLRTARCTGIAKAAEEDPL